MRKREYTGWYLRKVKECFVYFGKNNAVNPQNKTKKFNVDASVRYKRKSVEEHAYSAQHVAALEAELMSRDSTFQKQIDRREQINHELYYNVFLSMYWIAKEEIPNCKFNSLIKLLELVKLPDIETVRVQVLQKVGKANFFSILCNEVCDISNREQLVTFVHYVDQDSGKADVKFLAIDYVLEEYDSANAYAIKSVLVKQIAAAKLEKIIVGIVSKETGAASVGN